MKPTLEEYCRTVDEQAAKFAREETNAQRNDHLRAFNFGRMTQRIESARQGALLRAGWLLMGLVLGAALGTSIPSSALQSLPGRVLSKAQRIVNRVRNSAIAQALTKPE